jgi:hypothetical protein
MSDWAKKQVEAINKASEHRQNEAEARVLNARLKREQGPILWEQLRNHLQTKSVEFNREARTNHLKIEPTPSDEFRVRLTANLGAMLVQYSPHDNAGRYVINGKSHRFDVTLIGGGVAVLRRAGAVLNPEEFAESLLEELIHFLSAE